MMRDELVCVCVRACEVLRGASDSAVYKERYRD